MKLNIPKAIRWTGDELFLLDQTQLPLQIVEDRQESIVQVWESIKQLKVRGAPAIGISAAYGLLIGLRDSLNLPLDDFKKHLVEKATYLDSSRPTAVNLHWAMQRMVNISKQKKYSTTVQLYDLLKKEAEEIDQEDKFLCQKLGEYGATLIKPGMGILTHCNTGAIATAGIGTALGAMYAAAENGIEFEVYADETRPLLQGARLTTWELQQAGIDVTLITDNMAGHLMSKGLIDLVIVGTDRVVANGDFANKIGTMSVAILASYFNIPFYVSCASSTIDFSTATGDEIKIEERQTDEVTAFGGKRIAPDGVNVRNPAFDVTPNRLLTGLITEKGIISAPYKDNLEKMFPEHQSNQS